LLLLFLRKWLLLLLVWKKKVDAAMGNTLKMLRYLVDAAHDAASGAKAAALALNFVLADALSQAAGDA